LENSLDTMTISLNNFMRRVSHRIFNFNYSRFAIDFEHQDSS
jgi:hypothetical protein